MKKIGISQRVEIIKPYGETRDALDRRWISLCETLDLLPVPIPNHPLIAIKIIENLKLDGIILSGGNTLHSYGGDAPERDEVERSILQYALAHQIPVLGVCRGMQLIQDFFGIPLKKIQNHVGNVHEIMQENQLLEVNSYHDYGTKHTNKELQIIAKSKDGIIEAVKHRRFSIHGIMWHPERNSPYKKEDKQLLAQIFGVK